MSKVDPAKHERPFDRTHDSAYLRLFNALLKIADGFQTPDELLQDSMFYDLDPLEVLSMAYENMQEEARYALEFVRAREME